MKFSLQKTALIGVSAIALSMVSMTPAYAMKADPEFKYAVKHSNFMPTLMAVAMKNIKALELSDEQLKTLKNYHQSNSPQQRQDMKQVVTLEKEAAAVSLNGDLKQAQKLGQQSIALRQTIFNQKLRCHLMMQETLSSEQYNKLLAIAKKAN